MHVPRPNYLSPVATNRGEAQLLGFCRWASNQIWVSLLNRDLLVNQSRSLVLGPTDEEMLGHFILRIAFSSPSDTTNPVLQSVFALASLQLHGTLNSFRYKRLVLSLIRDSINWLNEKTLLENLIAIMLLYHYEVF